MPIAVACGSCNARLNAPDQAAGKRVKCPKCAAVIPVPAPADDFEVLDDEPPPKKPARKVVDDEDDDRPVRKRSRRDDDDEEEDRPRPKRRKKGKPAAKSSALPILLVIAGVLLLAAGGWAVIAFVLNNRNDEVAGGTKGPVPGPETLRGATPGRLGGPDGTVNADWELFDRPEFSVMLPKGGEPAQRSADAEKQSSAQYPGSQIWVKQGSSGHIYMVMVMPLTPQMQQEIKQDRASAIKKFSDRIASAPAGKVQSNKPVSFNGHDGHQAMLTIDPTVKSVFRMTLTTNGGIVAAVAGPFQSEDDPEVKSFLDSFRPK